MPGPSASGRIRELLADSHLEDLFLDELLWNATNAAPITIETGGGRFQLRYIAQKAGAVAFECSAAADGRIPSAATRAAIEQKAQTYAFENLVIYLDAGRTQQLWRAGRSSATSFAVARRCFTSGITEGILQTVRQLRFDMFGEPTTVEVGTRIRDAFYDDRRAFYALHHGNLQHAEAAAGLPALPNPLDEYQDPNFLQYQAEANRHPVPDFDEQQRLGRLIAHGTAEERASAIRELTVRNLRLVVSMAGKYRHRGVDLMDLIQYGNIGLHRAAQKFDYKRDLMFSTYAYAWIRQGITRALGDDSRTIRAPVHLHEQLNKLRRFELLWLESHTEAATSHELADYWQAHDTSAEVDATRVERLRSARDLVVPCLDVDQLSVVPWLLEPEQLAGDVARAFDAEDGAPGPHEATAQVFLEEDIASVFETLVPRERRVLNLRFGPLDGRSRTLEEVGREFGVTRERIRQIEAKALRKLRHPSRARRLRGFVDQAEDPTRETVAAWERYPTGALWRTADFRSRRLPPPPTAPNDAADDAAVDTVDDAKARAKAALRQFLQDRRTPTPPQDTRRVPYWDVVSPARHPRPVKFGRPLPPPPPTIDVQLVGAVEPSPLPAVPSQFDVAPEDDFLIGAELDFVVGDEHGIAILPDDEPDRPRLPQHQPPLDLPGALPLFDQASQPVPAPVPEAAPEPGQLPLLDLPTLAPEDAALALAAALAAFQREGYKILDMRPKGGAVWVIDLACDLPKRIAVLKEQGVSFTYAPRSHHGPGWWTK